MSMSATATQLLSCGEFYKLRYDTTPVKSASADVSFYTNNLKIQNLKLWHSCSKRAICRNIFPFETVFKQTSNNIRILIPEERNSLLPPTRYGLDGPGIKFRWGARCSTPVQTGPGAHPAFYTKRTGTFSDVKRLKSGVDHPPRINGQVK